MDLLALHEHVARCLELRDLDGYLALMHPEVEFTTVAFGERRVFRGHRGVREWWTVTAASIVYDAYAIESSVIADDAIVVRARIRAPQPEGGFLDVEGHWLLVVRCGLVWRYRPVSSEDDARTELARLAGRNR